MLICFCSALLCVPTPLYWRRQWHPTPVLLPGKSHGPRILAGCSPWGRWESDTTERLHFHALEKEMATHCSVFAWRIPGTGEPGGLPSMGSHRVWHDWSDLAAAVACLCTLRLYPLYHAESCWFSPKHYIRNFFPHYRKGKIIVNHWVWVNGVIINVFDSPIVGYLCYS